MARSRYGRPSTTMLIWMMAANAVAAIVVLYIVFAAFGIGQVLTNGLGSHMNAGRVPPDALVPFLPGAAIAYGCLWYWMVVYGRAKGVPWTGGLIYGVIISLCNVPAAGFILGLLNGSPLLGFVLALLSLLLIPAMFPAISLFGLLMGGLNAFAASLWIERHRA